MKRLLAMLVLGVLGVAVGGCTMTMDPQEHKVAVLRNMNIDARQMVEDWDTFWLCDKPSSLTKWYVPQPE